jgi:hypothetical protein
MPARASGKPIGNASVSTMDAVAATKQTVPPTDVKVEVARVTKQPA